ncbi:hypothetical protein MNV49_005571 [Pseudohyphozyma bogoriensis]|nr:hypothetical protein MNV49_005571 [Pseudohyphozyma bogoriensis]
MWGPLFALALVVSSTASPLANEASTPRRALDLRAAVPPTVQIKNGTIQGLALPDLDQEIFLGIPYAQAPVGDLRLELPRAINTTWSTAFDASSYGNVCPGYGTSSQSNVSLGQPYNLSEDCLNIQIVRPAGAQSGDSLPVLFWIFGGGFTQGAANDPRYNGSYIVQRSIEQKQPIIFASINYRLGAFGWPASPATAAAGLLNLGLKDQRFALQWVQDNIKSFGGDPKKVTIWGQSAGGVAVVNQLVAYGGRDDGLFRAGIVSSGVNAAFNQTVASQTPAWNTFLNATGCTAGDDEIACLKGVDYATFYNASSKFGSAAIPDGDFMRQSSMKAIDEGKVVVKPLMLGCVKDEATVLGVATGLQNETQWRTAVANAYSQLTNGNTTGTIDEFSRGYPNDPAVGCPHGTGDGVLPTGLQDKRIASFVTDNTHAGIRLFSRKHSNVAPTWSFRFEQVPQNGTMELGVGHAYELPYVFGVLNRTIRSPLGNRPGDLGLSELMQTAYINFVNNGNPNVGAKLPIYWETYDETSSNIAFKNNATAMAKDDYRSEGIEAQIRLATVGEV